MDLDLSIAYGADGRQNERRGKRVTMSDYVTSAFAPLSAPRGGVYVVFVDASLNPAAPVRKFLEGAGDLIATAAKIANFRGKFLSSMDILAPAGVECDRLLVVGAERDKDSKATDFSALGGYVLGKIGSSKGATIAFAAPEGAWRPESAAEFMLGAHLRGYRFDKYKTKIKPEDKPATVNLTIGVADAAAARSAAQAETAIVGGVELARDLVNEPPNVLFPVEFADRVNELRKLGVQVEVLDEKAMAKLGMGSLLGVGQGSTRESRVAIMRWSGAKNKKAKPVAFVGKGVCFDTGGISIKPAAGMEDMKGDMAGAACVTGLIYALASRKAKVNAIGAIGLVENMPDGDAIRPGDILTSMSGQTIEIINTDAEGRLVLADVLWYVQDKYKPVFMIDLATLTGAILVALGAEHAGLFSNNDELASRLSEAGIATGETVWRMPLGAAYDKVMDSKFADVKNAGGRHAGSITAAQFLQRFVNGVPWAHLDIAGVGMNSPASEINHSWGSGWGVRLLDRLVADHYEK
jgi:leucyl aminopeptidase